ncbi:MAG: HAD hydrolase-like protein [Rhodobacterales bacterium]|nr:HAD hydrolase-like protein [Rhodobacterales bacterium]
MAAAIPMAEFLRGGWTGRAAVLADLDGCLISGGTVLPQVPALFDACGERLWVVSNNSTDTAAGLSRRLAAMGLDLAADRILLAGEETLHTLAAAYPGARIALFAAPPLQALAQDLGLVLSPDRAEIAVLARDTGFGFADLARLAALVHRGAALWLTNPDPSHPGPDGVPVPETGALFAALDAMLPRGLPQCLGKPAPDLIRKALARAAVLPGAAVYIGDTPQTDGAAAAGVEFVQIAPPAAAAGATAGAVSC